MCTYRLGGTRLIESRLYFSRLCKDSMSFIFSYLEMVRVLVEIEFCLRKSGGRSCVTSYRQATLLQ